MGKFCKFILTFSLFIIFGCSKVTAIEYDAQYGVEYYIKSDNSFYSIVVHLDPKHQDIVSSLSITSTTDILTQELSSTLMSKYYNYPPFDEDRSTTYYFSDDMLFIEIDFYRIDSVDEIFDLITYLGLQEELKDKVLYYEKELLNSENFIFAHVFKNGIYNNNISLTKESKYNYK